MGTTVDRAITTCPYHPTKPFSRDITSRSRLRGKCHHARTERNTPMTTTVPDPAVDLSVPRYVAGTDYDETAEWSLDAVAQRLQDNTAGLQRDEWLPPQATFAVTADTTGTTDLIHVTISGLETPPPGTNPLFYDHVQHTRDTVATVMALASNYDRVERAHPDRARFLVAIDVIHRRRALSRVSRHDAVDRRRRVSAPPRANQFPARTVLFRRIANLAALRHVTPFSPPRSQSHTRKGRQR